MQNKILTNNGNKLSDTKKISLKNVSLLFYIPRK
jgi:hypothetical protein